MTGPNPMSEVKPYPVNPKRREYSADELLKILEAARAIESDYQTSQRAKILKYAHRIVSLLLLTGMRSGEVLGLKWENIKDGRITVPRTETKQKREKSIPMTPRIAEVLATLPRNGEYVFGLNHGAKRQDTHGLMLEIRQRTGISDFVLHGLRHTAASIMVSEALGQGVGLPDIMQILGHSRVETTLRYLHPDANRMKKAMRSLEKRLEN